MKKSLHVLRRVPESHSLHSVWPTMKIYEIFEYHSMIILFAKFNHIFCSVVNS